MLEQVVGRPITEAACPFGSYDRRVLRQSAAHGYRRAYTSDAGTGPSTRWLQATNTVRRDDAAASSSPGRRATTPAAGVARSGREEVAVTVAARSVCPDRRRRRRRVAAFLHANLNERVSTEQWAGAIDVPWDADPPNSGFMLLDGAEVVGVQLAFYSERTIDSRRERFCNLGAWCVLPRYRVQGLRLLRAALSQDGYHFTDLSPSGNVVEINTRLGFRFLDTATRLVPNLPWPTVPGRA